MPMLRAHVTVRPRLLSAVSPGTFGLHVNGIRKCELGPSLAPAIFPLQDKRAPNPYRF